MTQPSSRREFLLHSGALAALPLVSGLPLPRPAQERRAQPLLVVVYLRGGADFLNMVAPVEDKRYRELRPTIALSLEDGAVPLDDGFALHPALAPLWKARQFAPVICTGSPHDTRSHFTAQDFMERAAPGMPSVTTGWLNRYLAASARKDQSEFRAVALQTLLPRSLRGDYAALAVAPSRDQRAGEATLDEFEGLYGKGGEMEERRDEELDVVSSGRTTIHTLRRFNEIVAGAQPAEEAGYPRSGFASQLRTIAAVAKADCGLEVAAVDYNGWDHHINQGGLEGAQARMLADYAASLTAFCRDLGPRLEHTLVLTMTEFGRTVRENGNSGSDHGRGSGMFLVGGGVRGGRIHGKWKGLADKELEDGRDLPVTTDFRDVLAASLDGTFGFAAPKDFFPDYKPRSMALF